MGARRADFGRDRGAFFAAAVAFAFFATRFFSAARSTTPSELAIFSRMYSLVLVPLARAAFVAAAFSLLLTRRMMILFCVRAMGEVYTQTLSQSYTNGCAGNTAPEETP